VRGFGWTSGESGGVKLCASELRHPDESEAIRRWLDGFRFFGYSLGYYALFGERRPGRADLWERFLQVKDQLPDNAERSGIGTPDQLRAHLERCEKAGIDQVMFIQQSASTGTSISASRSRYLPSA
jgi:hypothetical protein